MVKLVSLLNESEYRRTLGLSKPDADVMLSMTSGGPTSSPTFPSPDPFDLSSVCFSSANPIPSAASIGEGLDLLKTEHSSF